MGDSVMNENFCIYLQCFSHEKLFPVTQSFVLSRSDNPKLPTVTS